MIRPFISGLSFASVLFAPPWAPLILMGVLSLRFRAWEILIMGVCVDLLYLPPGGFYMIPIPATICATAILIGFEPFRRNIMT
ncbi:MAG: hypothetical protein AAB421_05060 [Patescibacteria group bacterium]